MRAWFNRMDIRRKLMLSYLVVVFIPILVVGLVLTNAMRTMAREQTLREAAVNQEHVRARFSAISTVVTGLASKTFVDQRLDVMLNTVYDDPARLVEAYAGYSDFDDFLYYAGDIADIRLWCYNGTLLDNGRFMRITPDTESSDWFRRALADNGGFHWQYLPHERTGEALLTFSVLVRGSRTNNRLGVLLIYLRNEALNSLVDGETWHTVIVDPDGIIIASPDAAERGVPLRDTAFGAVNGVPDGTTRIRADGAWQEAVVRSFSLASERQTFRLVSLLPRAEVEAAANKAGRIGFLLIGGSLLLSTVAILLFSGSIATRIRTIGEAMHRVAGGDFQVPPPSCVADEIGGLSRDLAHMAESLDALVREVYEANLQKNQLQLHEREIKLQLLANQVNPHFLFNVLEAIRMKARIVGQPEIADVVRQLGKLMRRMLETGSEPIPLDMEMDLVKSYLDIQHFRYGDRLTAEVAWDAADIGACLVLPLLVQPIVENAVIHGLESVSEPGRITVTAERDEDCLLIRVSDDGEGMSAERLEQVRQDFHDPQDSAGRRIGLRNVHQRIRLTYGEPFGVSVDSEPDTGTRVILRLPAIAPQAPPPSLDPQAPPPCT